jgi:hypothetical protein
MKIKINDTNGLILKTKDKVCKEDIDIVLDDSISNGINPTGTINITSNGIVDVTHYASANVDVAGSGGSQGYQLKTMGSVLAYKEGYALYSLDDGNTWVDFYTYHRSRNLWLWNVKNIKFKINKDKFTWMIIKSNKLGLNISSINENQEINVTLNENVDDLEVYFENDIGGEV